MNKLDSLGVSAEGHVGTLDGLRGAAFLLVFMFHSLNGTLRTDTLLGKGLNRFFCLGWVGVDLFFVLSGFLITSILLKARDSENYYKVFYARRALRILPLYYLVLISSLTLAQHNHYPWNVQVFFWLNLQRLNPKDHAHNAAAIFYSMIQLSALFGISALSYKFFELPMLSLKKHFRYEHPHQHMLS